ncbi:GT2 family glycosyltransferase [Saccharothrix coeruleofusca]|uniref:glycosyltransferase family 2 protein n=1 Tax=Saccharothrix coeruleofusca TaxID=33919 RepID=UPI001AE4E0A0|nr:glycosyltransferase family 2 protein [Saccharothrix coeruleofusca]MBP2339105.1 GT2 family glycosyltransferase [Saccharothrix coeruleofusca]
MTSGATPRLRTAPVLAVLVCHDGARWLGEALAALRDQRPRPRHVLAVDTGSLDGTAELLAEASAGPDRLVDGVLPLSRDTGFAEAVHAAVDHAVRRWGDPGSWIWVLHDDCAPEPDCLSALLTAAEVAPSAAVLGPLALDWADPRLVVEAGLSTDASGHRQTGIGGVALVGSFGSFGQGAFEQSTEVLAVPSAGSLIRRAAWESLGGYDRALPLLREDVDFGWRANRAGHLVLSVPVARMRHARAVGRGERGLDAVPAPPGPTPRGVDRAHGLRTFLVNCSALSYVLGLPRTVLLLLLRALGFLLLRRFSDAQAEVAALRYLFGGRAGLRAGRAARPHKGGVPGLFTSRITRLRNAIRDASAYLVRRRVQADAALGRLPETAPRHPSEVDGPRPVGPQALPAGALSRRRPVRATGGLRRPATAVPVSAAPVSAVPVTAELPSGVSRPSPRPRPSPVPRGTPAPAPGIVFVEVDRARVLRSVVLGPPLLLALLLTAFGLLANSARLGLDLAGGRLLPVPDLAGTWSAYLAAWHPVAGGTSAPAPAALAVLGVLGVLGGPQFAVAALLLGDAPLAGLAAYAATRRLPVRRPVRAVAAAAYALLPPATSAVAQGRLDAVVAHVLLPLVLAGLMAVLRGGTGAAWLPVASGTALALAALGAFSPLAHGLVAVAALVGFVLVPGRVGDGRRRVAGLFIVVLLPLALLLPWPAVVIQHPSVLLHGVGAHLAPAGVGVADLLALRPGGPGALPFAGAVVVLAALAAVVLRPSRAMLPGAAALVAAAFAVIALLAVPVTPLTGGAAEPGWTGVPLVIAGWGLLWVVLAAARRDLPPVRWPVRRLASAAALVGVLALACAGFAGLRQGPLRAEAARLPSTVQRELPSTGRSVLVLGAPTRQVGGRLPAFGDDDLVPTPTSAARLERWRRDLTGGSAEAARVALTQAAASGVAFVVPEDRESARRLRDAAGELVSEAPPLSDGRPVLRVRQAAGGAVLLSPELARRARTGGDPPADQDAPGTAPVEAGSVEAGSVEAGPPELGVRVSEGPQGRLLVVAAEDEPGWRATVDGDPAPVVRAWGHLVAVPVPATAADVRVEAPGATRDLLLLLQAAAALLTVWMAAPPLITRPRELSVRTR